MEEILKLKAQELGFDDCQITSANSPENAHRLRSWLDEGNQGAMDYLERNFEKRADLLKVLPNARSVVTLAINYNSKGAASSSDGTQAIIARYALYDDYHKVLKTRLRELSKFIDKLGNPETKSLWYADTGPVLERDLAQRAGLGFIGKHTNLISRKLGNWFFIAEILTTLPLLPDRGEKNRCGSCTRCITACPTMAIKAPFILDARRCISYLTIEFKGSIPLPLRPLFGNRIYGCDICLEACPWNRFAKAARMMAQHFRSNLAALDLVDLLSLDEIGFKEKFAGTPILRTGWRGLIRNVCVAIGNVGNTRALPRLKELASGADELIAEHAAWAIAGIEDREKPPKACDFIRRDLTASTRLE
jgi:epoxyqueuosine reductase